MVGPTDPDRPESADPIAAAEPELPGWDNERAVFAPDAALDWPETLEPRPSALAGPASDSGS
ncbi:MAG TPA: hypothetical protein VJY39_12635 [Acidisphaera sp.]|nr:hypothetical protein [Acidisphaera sp.]